MKRFFRRPAFFLVFGLVVSAVSFGLWQRLRPVTPAAPLSVGLWYWHQPFRIAPGETEVLRRAGVTELFVRAGTFTRDRETGVVGLSLRQVWAKNDDTGAFPVHLVFNADYALIRRFEQIGEADLQSVFVQNIARERTRAEAAGVRVAGVQIDFDCPTRLLPRYARLLGVLRSQTRGAFSITALPTWLGSPDNLALVARNVDFFVPQFYEAQTPKSLKEFATISDEARLVRGLQAAGKLGLPFRAGLPAYGRALVFDGMGQMRGAFHDASASDIARQSEFRVVRAFPAGPKELPAQSEKDYIGEDIIELGPSASNRGGNFHLVYDLPTPVLVARQLGVVREKRPANCTGVILYRYPEQNGTEAVPLPALAAVLEGKTPAPKLKVTLKKRPYAPWSGIESASKENGPPLINLWVTVTNNGDGPTRHAPTAVELEMRFDRPGDVRDLPTTRGFDAIEARSGNKPASLARADTLYFRALYLGPGESQTWGPIRVAADAKIRDGLWQAEGPGGFTRVRGETTFSEVPK